MGFSIRRMRGLRRKFITYAVVIAALPSFADATNGYFKSPEGCAVWRVIDGDTIAMRCPDGYLRLRLAAIDTPELRGGCWGETWRAAAAKQRLRWAFLMAAQIDLPDTGRTDRYGRRLGPALVDGQPAAAQLIDARLAVPYVPNDMTWCERIERGEI